MQFRFCSKINTWAIFWYATIFLNNGVCLNPTMTFVENIGLDGSGENCKEEVKLRNNQLNSRRMVKLPKNINISENIVKEITKEFYSNRNFLFKLIRRVFWK